MVIQDSVGQSNTLTNIRNTRDRDTQLNSILIIKHSPSRTFEGGRREGWKVTVCQIIARANRYLAPPFP